RAAGTRRWCVSYSPPRGLDLPAAMILYRDEDGRQGALLDPPRRLGKHRRRNREPHSPRGPEVDDQLERAGLLHGKVAWPGALEDLVHIGRRVAHLAVEAGRIRHEPAHVDELAVAPHGGDPALDGELHHRLAVLGGQDARRTEERLRALARHRGERSLELARFPHRERLEG